jgi:hypothetical protein
VIIVRISNNAIYDFINSSTSSNGIYLGRIQPLGQSQPIVLRDNQFCALAGTLVYTAISIDNAVGNNFTVSNNHMVVKQL